MYLSIDVANRNVEVDSTGDAVNITMDLPGVELADINLEVDEFNVVITAKNGVRNYKFNRTFKFSLDAEKAKATFKNGVLNVSVEKVAKPDMKKVTIEG
jgi:HSP20 family protein